MPDWTLHRWEILLDEWLATGKLTEEEHGQMLTLVTDDIWDRERWGYEMGRGASARMAHGETWHGDPH
jgi:hypothetical protein